jgi:hypothetical protein
MKRRVGREETSQHFVYYSNEVNMMLHGTLLQMNLIRHTTCTLRCTKVNILGQSANREKSNRCHMIVFQGVNMMLKSSLFITFPNPTSTCNTLHTNSTNRPAPESPIHASTSCLMDQPISVNKKHNG